MGATAPGGSGGLESTQAHGSTSPFRLSFFFPLLFPSCPSPRLPFISFDCPSVTLVQNEEGGVVCALPPEFVLLPTHLDFSCVPPTPVSVYLRTGAVLTLSRFCLQT